MVHNIGAKLISCQTVWLRDKFEGVLKTREYGICVRGTLLDLSLWSVESTPVSAASILGKTMYWGFQVIYKMHMYYFHESTSANGDVTALTTSRYNINIKVTAACYKRFLLLTGIAA